MLAVLVDIELATEPVEESERKSDHGIFFWTAQAQRSQDLAAWQRLRANRLNQCQQPTSTHSIAIPIRHF